ncbi:MAG: hypothetical protein JWO46_2796 [Nocardioidaceae bacterium]|nr:hypothetical protein [Nocardioidaceae bacterium]
MTDLGTRRGWRTDVSDDEVQVHPIADLLEHELTGDGCICGPRAECIPRDDDSDVWMYVHQALDGRE